MSIFLLPREIVSIILNYLHDVYQFIALKTISKNSKNIIENISWYNKVIIRNRASLVFFTTKINVKCASIRYKCVEEDFTYMNNIERIYFATPIHVKGKELEHLRCCTYLYAKNSSFTDKSLRYLHHSMETLFLSSTNGITNQSLKYLKYCKYLHIDGTCVGGEEIRHLKNCKGVYLACTKIIDEDLKYLSNCEELDLLCTKITDKGLPYISNCKSLILSLTKITDVGMKYLTKCSYLSVSYNDITDEGLQYIGKDCRMLDLSNTKITDNGLKYIQHVPVLYLSYTNITNDGLLYLFRCKKLAIGHTKVTKEGMDNFLSINKDVEIII